MLVTELCLPQQCCTARDTPHTTTHRSVVVVLYNYCQTQPHPPASKMKRRQSELIFTHQTSQCRVLAWGVVTDSVWLVFADTKSVRDGMGTPRIATPCAGQKILLQSLCQSLKALLYSLYCARFYTVYGSQFVLISCSDNTVY